MTETPFGGEGQNRLLEPALHHYCHWSGGPVGAGNAGDRWLCDLQ
jgi:hypothetical protein